MKNYLFYILTIKPSQFNCHAYFIVCGPTEQVGRSMNSSQSYPILSFPESPFGLQHDQYFLRSWKTASPVWYWQAVSFCSASVKVFALQPLFAHINLPSLFSFGAFGLAALAASLLALRAANLASSFLLKSSIELSWALSAFLAPTSACATVLLFQNSADYDSLLCGPTLQPTIFWNSSQS